MKILPIYGPRQPFVNRYGFYTQAAQRVIESFNRFYEDERYFDTLEQLRAFLVDKYNPNAYQYDYLMARRLRGMGSTNNPSNLQLYLFPHIESREKRIKREVEDNFGAGI